MISVFFVSGVFPPGRAGGGERGGIFCWHAWPGLLASLYCFPWDFFSIRDSWKRRMKRLPCGMVSVTAGSDRALISPT